jgi:hypothetical protein
MKRRDVLQTAGAGAALAVGVGTAAADVSTATCGSESGCDETYCTVENCDDCPDCCYDTCGGCLCSG